MQSVKALQHRDKTYGEPRTTLACSGELKRIFLKYAARSPRRISPGEHEAVDLIITKLSRIATGPTALEENYVDGSMFFGLAGEAALGNSVEARSVMAHEAAEEEAEMEDLDSQTLLGERHTEE